MVSKISVVLIDGDVMQESKTELLQDSCGSKTVESTIKNQSIKKPLSQSNIGSKTNYQNLL